MKGASPVKHLMTVLSAAAIFAIPMTATAASAPSAAMPAGGVLPPEMCDGGRSAFASFIEASQPMAPVFGPMEQAACGERKSYPG
jgi:hypothetical protein